MCLAKAFTDSSSKLPILEDIARVQVQGNSLRLESLFGEFKVIPGRLVEIDFAASRILLDAYREADRR